MELIIYSVFEFMIEALMLPLVAMTVASVIANLCLAVLQIQEQSVGFLLKVSIMLVFFYFFGEVFFSDLEQFLSRILERFPYVGDTATLFP